MTRYGPRVSGRGNVAPPPGYRPGRKLAALRPRPVHPRPEPDTMPFTLVQIPFDQTLPNLIDPPDNGADIYTVPAGSFCDATILWVSPPDQPSHSQINPSDDPNNVSGTLCQTSSADGGQIPSVMVQQATPRATAGAARASALPSILKAISPTHLYLACVSDAAPVTSLSGIVLLKLYS